MHLLPIEDTLGHNTHNTMSEYSQCLNDVLMSDK